MHRIEWVIGSLVSFFTDNLFIPSNILTTRKFLVTSSRSLDLHSKPIADTYNLAVAEENSLRDKYAINCTMCSSDGGHTFWNLCSNLNFWNAVKPVSKQVLCSLTMKPEITYLLETVNHLQKILWNWLCLLLCLWC